MSISYEQGEGQAAYVAKWLADINERIAWVIVRAAFVYCVFLSPLNLVFVQGEVLKYCIGTGLVMGAVASGIIARRQIWKKTITPATIALVTVAQIALSLSVRVALTGAPPGAPTWIYPMVLTGISFILLVTTPTQRRVIWMAQVKIGAVFFIYALVTMGLDQSLIAVLGLMPGAVVVFKLVADRFLRQIGEQEFRIKELAGTQERLRYENEMELARRIQDSFGSPVGRLGAGPVSISWYQSKHGVVGGDWVAARQLPDDRWAVLVADAAGKGIQAALVIHAVQSLWADALASEAFDAASWITRVNAMLCILGKREPHAVTLGLLIVGLREVTYWSAGHLPVFLVSAAEPTEVKALLGRGSMLGVSDAIELNPVHLALDAKAEIDLLLGSDGVFLKGPRVRRRELDELVRDVAKNGADALRTLPGDDDKTLVWIRHLAA